MMSLVLCLLEEIIGSLLISTSLISNSWTVGNCERQ